jgi:GMP synthase-like glutamine amidotransferase
MSVNDNLPWLLAELRLIKEAIAKNIPLLGHCLGGQLISKALGAEITKNSVSEVGWHMCQRTECSASSAWLNGLPNSFIMFHWHNETFALPPQAKHLFSSQYCENQAYSYGHNVFAMQGHVEMTVPLATYWIEHWQDQLRTSSPSQQSYDEIKVDLQKKITALNTVADSIYSCWVATLAKQ